jgi:hypothetical protein
MNDELKKRIRRQQNRIEVLEARNLSLREEVERLTHGAVKPWTPFERVHQSVFGDGRVLSADHDGFDRCVTWVNSRYQVAVYRHPLPGDGMPDGTECFHLSIKRVDGAACHDWRDLQRIKNELVGTEAEGVELYPAESRLVDGANQYHLYVLAGCAWPVGFRDRLVAETSIYGVQQRPFAPDQRPDDLSDITAERMAAFVGLKD